MKKTIAKAAPDAANIESGGEIGKTFLPFPSLILSQRANKSQQQNSDERIMYD